MDLGPLSGSRKKRTFAEIAKSQASSVLLTERSVMPSVLCCVCGVSTQWSASSGGMCVDCLKGEVDITQAISRSSNATFCRECGRWQRTDGGWQRAELESRELLAVCLKRVKGLDSSGCRLIDAGFIWTEPNSKRLKVKLTVQKELSGVSGGAAVMQQELTVEYIVQYVQCDDCKRTYTPHVWNAVVQLRQKCEHKRTFFYLEQLILKHNMHAKVVSIKNRTDGLDFHFGHRMHAQRFADFVHELFPCKTSLSKHLVSHDSNNNTYNYKYAFQTDLAPVNRDDLVFVPSLATGHRAKSLAGVSGSLLLCTKVSTNIHLFDPLSGKALPLAGVEFWKHPFAAVCGRKHLSEFVVLAGGDDEGVPGAGAGAGAQGQQLVELARSDALGGEAGSTIHVPRSSIPISGFINYGDLLMGYDLRSINLSGAAEEDLANEATEATRKLEVVLVRKAAPKTGERRFVLKGLMKTGGDDKKDQDRAGMQDDQADIEEFMKEVEEDEELRRDINLYRRPGRQQPLADAHADDAADMDELENLLQDLTLNENETTL